MGSSEGIVLVWILSPDEVDEVVHGASRGLSGRLKARLPVRARRERSRARARRAWPREGGQWAGPTSVPFPSKEGARCRMRGADAVLFISR